MQTILGAGGPIADGLVRELRRTYDGDIRIVSRRPAEVTAGDQLVAADLTDAAATSRAVAGSDVAYLTVGLPMDSDLWERRFPTMMRNVLDACIEHGAKLVFFDNTYMYPRTSTPQTESTAFEPVGRKSQVRAHIATMLLAEQAAGRVEALIARAPEFYGPGKTTSLTNTFVLDRIREGKRPMVPVSANTKRSLIWTPDASRAMALLGNTADAYGQTWHLPIDPDRKTYAELIGLAAEVGEGRSATPSCRGSPSPWARGCARNCEKFTNSYLATRWTTSSTHRSSPTVSRSSSRRRTETAFAKF
ncbi:NAD-dependent epimerase/dehydratase family protein [Gordonia humi]|uniref:NAD-dependent epimerase/dehydratase family protein n=1 Tax=Gordonia humi TaxID=686429 RepID=UPI00361F859C